MLLLHLICALLAQQTLAFLGQDIVNRNLLPYPRDDKDSRRGSYQIPNTPHNGTSKVQFDIPTPGKILDIETLLSLHAPQIYPINSSVFDWWYFDAVSETNSNDSLVVTFFASTFAAFPYLRANETSLVNVWLWASFANGTVFGDYAPATVATVTTGPGAGANSSGEWLSTGFSWAALTEDLTKYEVVIASEKMQVEGRMTLTSKVPRHLPCGIQEKRTKLEIAPHIGWVNLVPDAAGEVDITIRGSTLKFRGPGYHDKNWSDRPFMDSVESWYWGHGRLGPYSIVWFSYLARDDPTKTTYVSSYVAKDGKLLVSSCDPSLLIVRPIGSPGTTGTTGGRYPPRVGDIPEGFRLEYDLGENNSWLIVNVTITTLVAGDGESYMRWTGDMVGEVTQSESQGSQYAYAAGSKRETRDGREAQRSVSSALAGAAVLEQFVMVE